MNPLSEEKLKFDYEQTNQYIGRLSNIRFDLLKFVPTIAGLAIVILKALSDDDSGKVKNNFSFISFINAETTFVVGLIGFFMTFGIIIYELRNSELYDAAIIRAKKLEELLGFSGGIFTDRPKAVFKIFGLFTIKHDRGLGFVYGAALGGWTYIIVSSLVSIIQASIPKNSLILIVILAGFLVVVMFYLHDNRKSIKQK